MTSLNELLSHISREQFESCVYEPAEDSFLLVDALLADAEVLARRAHDGVLRGCEIGVGSGYVSARLVHELREVHAARCAWTVSDVSEQALRAACGTLRRAGATHVDAHCGDLASALRAGAQFDVLLFNPPYVPTPADERGGSLQRTWAGGDDGREVLDRLLPHIAALLAPRGRFYLVALPENRPRDIERRLARDGLKGRLVRRKRAANEDLMILRFIKPATDNIQNEDI